MEREFIEGLGPMPEGAADAILRAHEEELEAVRAQCREEIAQRDFDQALDRALAGYTFTSLAARDAAVRAVRESGLAVGEDGTIQGLEAVMDGLRERDPGAFSPGRTPVRFTAPVTDGDSLTREQIIGIPDRALRRAAIAENMKLFKGEN